MSSKYAIQVTNESRNDLALQGEQRPTGGGYEGLDPSAVEILRRPQTPHDYTGVSFSRRTVADTQVLPVVDEEVDDIAPVTQSDCYNRLSILSAALMHSDYTVNTVKLGERSFFVITANFASRSSLPGVAITSFHQ